jgi:hypothetical protein
MKKIIILMCFLTACVQVSNPNPIETPLASTYPPCAPESHSEIAVTSTPFISSQELLGDELILFELLPINSISPSDRGCRYALRDRVNMRKIVLNNSLEILINPISEQQEILTVVEDAKSVFEIELRPYAHSGLLEAWSYDGHWIMEILTDNGSDILRDGKSLKEVNNYKQVFAFQILNNKPFYFYEKANNSFGINYNEVEVPLEYDDILYTNFVPGADQSIEHYQNMVIFSANKNGTWHNMVIGAFSNK